jgi:hypothetical protein
MHRSLGLAGAARAVEPERHVVLVGVRRRELILSGLQQIFEDPRSFDPAVRQDQLQRFGVPFQATPDLLVVLQVRDDGAGAAILDEESVVVGPEQGVHRDRDRADAYRGEERRREGGRVVEEEQDPVLLPYPKPFEGMPEPIDAAGKLPVGHLLVAAVDRHLLRAPGLQVFVDDQARVVPIRYRDHVLTFQTLSRSRRAPPWPAYRSSTPTS